MKNKSAIRYGTYLGFSLILANLVVFYGGLKENAVVVNLSNVLLFSIFIYYSVYDCRENEKGGLISFKEAFIQGVKTSAFSALLYAVYFYFYLTSIDPDIMILMEESTRLEYANQGKSPEEVQEAMVQYEEHMGPGFMAAASVAANVIFGGLISLPIAAILKRMNPNQIEA